MSTKKKAPRRCRKCAATEAWKFEVKFAAAGICRGEKGAAKRLAELIWPEYVWSDDGRILRRRMTRGR